MKALTALRVTLYLAEHSHTCVVLPSNPTPDGAPPLLRTKLGELFITSLIHPSLTSQVQAQATTIAVLQKREADLTAQLSIPLDTHIHDLLQQLKAQHEDLLHQQLAQVRRSYLEQLTEHTETAAVVSEAAEDITAAPAENVVFVQDNSNVQQQVQETRVRTSIIDKATGTRIIVVNAEDVATQEQSQVRVAEGASAEHVLGAAETKTDGNDLVVVTDAGETTVCSDEPEDDAETRVKASVESDSGAKSPPVNVETSRDVERSPRPKRRKKSH